MTAEEREQQILDALRTLEAQLMTGKAVVVVGPDGAVAIDGWDGRAGVTDACAYNRLMVSNSFAFQQAIAAAEAVAGRQVDANVVASGTHSHDGGKTWHPGH
jgi:hypothetical protein